MDKMQKKVLLISAWLLLLYSCTRLINPIEPASGDNDGNNGNPFINQLIFWNKLGSVSEVQNSEVGADGIVINNISFSSGMFGNGVTSSNYMYYVIFSNACSSPNTGTIQFWWQPYFLSSQTNFQTIVIMRNTIDEIDIYWDSGIQRLNVRVTDNGSLQSLYQFFFNFTAFQFAHITIQYNHDAAANNRIKLFKNGITQTLDSAPADNSWNLNNLDVLIINTNSPFYLDVVDNLKIYNYIRNTFSDIYNE